MSTNYTQNYNLCQWEASDKVLRADFNADNAKLEAALTAQKSAIDRAQSTASAAYSPSYRPVAVGSYTGNGASTQSIPLGFRPRAVMVISGDFSNNSFSGATSYIYNALAVDGAAVSAYAAVEITYSGFTVKNTKVNSAEIQTNASNRKYFYLAVR